MNNIRTKCLKFNFNFKANKNMFTIFKCHRISISLSILYIRTMYVLKA